MADNIDINADPNLTPEPAAEPVIKDVQPQTGDVTQTGVEQGTDEYYSQEEWDALPKDEQDKILQAFDTGGSPASTEDDIRERLRSEFQAEHEKAMARLEADYKRREEEFEIEKRRFFATKGEQLAEAARGAGQDVSDRYRDIREDAKRFKGEGWLSKYYTPKGQYDPANPPTDPSTGRSMSAQQIERINSSYARLQRDVISSLELALEQALGPVFESAEYFSGMKKYQDESNTWAKSMIAAGLQPNTEEAASIVRTLHEEGYIGLGQAMTDSQRENVVKRIRSAPSLSTAPRGGNGGLRYKMPPTTVRTPRRKPPALAAESGKTGVEAQRASTDALVQFAMGRD